MTSFLRVNILKGVDILAKKTDPYAKTKNGWDKRCLITVSTHLKLSDKMFLDAYCRRHGTTPYRILKSYLMDCIQLAKMDIAKHGL